MKNTKSQVKRADKATLSAFTHDMANHAFVKKVGTTAKETLETVGHALVGGIVSFGEGLGALGNALKRTYAEEASKGKALIQKKGNK